MIRFSFANLVSAATSAASTTFIDTSHPATNVQLFGRPFIRAYSAGLTAQRLTFDFGGTTSLDVIALINPNFVTVTIQGHASDTWGAPSYTSGTLTMGRSGNDRYHHAHRPSVAVPFTYRFLSLSIPNQATTDAATVFKVGSLWAGTIVSPPRDILFAPDEEKQEFYRDIATSYGAKIQRLKLGDEVWQVSGTRLAETETELAAWREIDRQWSAAPGQAALVLQRDAYPNEAYLARKMTSKWRHEKVWMASDVVYYELVAS